MTFSMIAFDPEDGAIGSAVVSKWTGVGGCTQFFRPGTGFVNLQNHSYAPLAHSILDKMEEGVALDDSLQSALTSDPMGEKRQCIIADLRGGFHVYSGDECTAIFHHKIGGHCAAAGNTLASQDVIEKMIETYEASSSEKMAERLMRSIEAGQAAGGDTRGEEAAAIKVYKTSYPQQQLYPLDLRVDSDERPLEKLRMLYEHFEREQPRVVL